MTILVTGSAGMIGGHLVQRLMENGYHIVGIDRKLIKFPNNNNHFEVDLGDKMLLDSIFSKNKIDRVIHLAALAHTTDGKKYPKSEYEYLNVACAKNIFDVAASRNIPILFISTVDVFGFQKGVVNAYTECHPVTIYGKTKFKAEQLLKESGAQYTIFRLSPVYTPNIKRDIQKRVYLKYPKWAYQIGKNTLYEVLDIDKATREMVEWCKQEPQNDLRIIKDDKLLETQEYIREEKEAGRAKHVIRIPRWIAVIGYFFLRITGKNKYTFLVNKAIHPLRSE